MATSEPTAKKVATRKRAVKKADTPATPPQGRVVPNSARPARMGFLQSVVQAAAATKGWKVKELSDPTPELVHLYGALSDKDQPKWDTHKVKAAGGLELTHTNGNVLRVSAFQTKDGSSNRMDAAYLHAPGATSGRRVQTVYQVMATIQNQGTEVAAVDTSRKRATKPEGEVKAQAGTKVKAGDGDKLADQLEKSIKAVKKTTKATAPKGTESRTPRKRVSKKSA
jgi:hypothetical protein